MTRVVSLLYITILKFQNFMRMNGKQMKAEITENIHDKFGTDRKDIHAVIDGFFDEVKDSLGKGMTADLRVFGTF